MNYWNEIKEEINAYFPDNNNKEITASRLRTVMNDVVNNINIWYYGTEEINDQYYTKSYIDTNFYRKSEVDDIEATLVEDLGDTNGRITNLEDNLSAYYYTKNQIDDNFTGVWDAIDSIYEETNSIADSVLSIQLSYATKSYVSSYYQDKLVSGTNIKTLDGMSILGPGNINLPDVNIIDDGTDITSANCKQNLKTIAFTPDTETFETVDLTLSNGTLESNFVLATTDYKNVNIVVGTERKIGTWTEGGETYDLYEKIVNIGTLPNTDTITVDHGVTNKVRFVETSGFAYGQNNINIPFVNASGSMFIYMGVGNTKITITTSSDRSNMTGYVTLRYIRARA